MQRTFLLSALLLSLALPASALASPGVVERVSQGPSGGNGPVHVDQGRISADGRCVAFDTTERLTSDDHNDRKDIYERCDGTTTLVSIGPAPNAGAAPNPYLEYRDMSADGSCVLFDTNDALTEDDGDSNIDIYKRCGGNIERVSQGPNGGNAAQDVHHGQISADGVCVMFQAHEPLTSDDHDSIPDIYERCGSTTKRISQGPAGGDDPAGYPQPGQITADGSCVSFETREKLTADDMDDQNDAYARCGSTTTKLTPGNGAFDESLDALSPDGKCVIFETEEQLAATDTDSQNDIYRGCGSSPAEHLSTGPAGGSGDFYASENDTSRSGTCVTFTTSERITADDTDSSADVYKRCGASVERVSTGAAGGNAEIVPQAFAISSDGTRVVFTTDERLTPDDTNDVTDIYERSNGETTRVSPDQVSSNPYGSNPQAASDDASRILFSRSDQLTGDDTDDRFDIYVGTIAPTAATGAATGVGQTGATLNGTSGAIPAAKYHFEYGTEPGTYGSSTPEADVPAGAGARSVSAPLSGLAPGTAYHYRLVVTSAGGATFAADRLFTTGANSGNDGGTGGGGDTGTPSPDLPFAGVAVGSGRVKVKRGIATVKVSCPASARGACTGTLTLKAKLRKLGAKGFKIASGKSREAKVKLSKAGRKLLAQRRSLRVKAIAAARDARGKTVTRTARLTLLSG